MKSLPVAKVVIKVTADTIKRGVPASDDSCAIALAIKEQLNCGYASVTEDLIEFEGKTFATPPKAAKFVEEFDKLEELNLKGPSAKLDKALAKLKPFEIEFSVPFCGSPSARVL